MPSGTPGESAFTGGLSMVMMAMSPSRVSLTSSLMRSWLGGSARGAIDHQARDSFAMVGCVAEANLTGLRAAIEKMHVVFPRESHAALHLHAAIAHFSTRVARVDFRDAHGGFRIGH